MKKKRPAYLQNDLRELATGERAVMMPPMRLWLLPLLILCLLPASGQSKSAVSPVVTRPLPAVHIMDQAGLFRTDPERLQALEKRLEDFKARFGFSIQIEIVDALIASDVLIQAQALQDRWFTSQPGWVAVFETDTRRFGLGVLPKKETELESGFQIPDGGPLDLTESEQHLIWTAVLNSQRQMEDPRDRVDALVNGLADHAGAIFAARLAPPSKASTLRIAVFAIGIISAAGLASLLTVAALRASDAKARQRYVFPEIHVGTRLGAPYGGGKISSREFGTPPHA